MGRDIPIQAHTYTHTHHTHTQTKHLTCLSVGISYHYRLYTNTCSRCGWCPKFPMLAAQVQYCLIYFLEILFHVHQLASLGSNEFLQLYIPHNK